MKLKVKLTKEEYRTLREWWREDAELHLVSIHFDLNIPYRSEDSVETEIVIEKL